MSTVLVTGGSGFVGSHSILQLLAHGHEVRTTVRNLKREGDVRAMLRQGGYEGSADRLTFFAANLEGDAGWPQAVAGCDYVLHVASPFPQAVPKDEDELIRPARDGALRVLRAARDARVRRVVLTSSFAAVGYGHRQRSKPFDETDWTNLDNPKLLPYTKSKTVAERAAWDFIAKEGGGLELAVVNPTVIFGPLLGSDFSTSVILIRRLMDGNVPGCPKLCFGAVDVRDVVDLHIRAMTDPAANGQRFLAVAGEFIMARDLAHVLKSRMGEAGRRVPTREIPDWVLRLSSVFDSAVKQVLPDLGKRKNATNAKARRVLGWAPRSNEDAIVATAESLVRLGLLQRPAGNQQSLVAEGVVKRGHGRGAGSGGAMRVFLVLSACAPAALTAASAQDLASPVGRWRTVDDKTGKPSGIVRIYEQNGALYGNIEKVFDSARAGLNCIACTDDRKDRPLIGLNIIRGLKREGDVWDGGTLIDPETGSVYKSSARLDDGGRKLVLRGYIGISLLGRSQTWQREP